MWLGNSISLQPLSIAYRKKETSKQRKLVYVFNEIVNVVKLKSLLRCRVLSPLTFGAFHYLLRVTFVVMVVSVL